MLTTSVFIPTIPNHIINLDNILDNYTNKQTIKPNQIVVSISDFSNVDKIKFNELSKKYNDVLFLKHYDIQLAGPNRQHSKYFCDQDIIIYQDSDDLPHIQRVEIIKHFFENHDIVQLNHSYVNLTQEVSSINNMNLDTYNENHIDINNINFVNSDEIYNSFFPNNNLLDCVTKTNAYSYKFPTHAGVVSIKRDVLETIEWKNRKDLYYSPNWNNPYYKGAEDYEFCMETLFNFNKSMIIDAKLYFYFG